MDVLTLSPIWLPDEGIENFAGSAVIISHDRWFLDRVATHILAFEGPADNPGAEIVFYEGNFSEFEEFRRKQGKDTEHKSVKHRSLT